MKKRELLVKLSFTLFAIVCAIGVLIGAFCDKPLWMVAITVIAMLVEYVLLTWLS